LLRAKEICDSTDRIRVGVRPLKNTVEPSVRYEWTTVDKIVRKGSLGSFAVPGFVMLRSELCMRVFTKSMGKVASQPAIPAKPPARKRTDHGML
jgi:hypothetical protein